jgi:hypothetical protein
MPGDTDIRIQTRRNLNLCFERPRSTMPQRHKTSGFSFTVGVRSGDPDLRTRAGRPRRHLVVSAQSSPIDSGRVRARETVRLRARGSAEERSVCAARCLSVGRRRRARAELCRSGTRRKSKGCATRVPSPDQVCTVHVDCRLPSRGFTSVVGAGCRSNALRNDHRSYRRSPAERPSCDQEHRRGDLWGHTARVRSCPLRRAPGHYRSSRNSSTMLHSKYGSKTARHRAAAQVGGTRSVAQT